MKKYLLLALSIVVLGCQKSGLEVEDSSQSVIREVTAVGSISGSGDTKAYVDSDWGVYWSENETLGGWVSEATTLACFSATNEEGSTYAAFTGEVAGDKIRFVHPYSSEAEITSSSLPISLASQSVNLSTSNSHLAQNMYMMSGDLEIVENEVEDFEMKHVGAIMNLELVFDGILLDTDKAEITKVELLGVPVEANLDLTATSAENCLSEVISDELLIATVTNAPEIEDGESISIPLAVLPGEVTALTVKVTFSVGVLQYDITKTIESTSATIERAKYHDFTITLNSSCVLAQKVDLDGSGTDDTPYLVSSKNDLLILADLVNGTSITSPLSAAQKTASSSLQRTTVSDAETQLYFKLIGDIDLGGSADNQWSTIGSYTSANVNSPFTGHFDGNGFTISGIYISNSIDYQGLFGYISSDAVVENLTVDGMINGDDNNGGIVGRNDGTVDNCHNKCDIYPDYCGGVVGYNSYIISNCTNSGTIDGYQFIGGIAGTNSRTGEITNCYNYGTITGSTTVGGIVGRNYAGEISNSYNSGSVIGSGDGVGGVVGYSSQGTITNSHNAGEITGSYMVGGVVGTQYGATIEECSNTAKISGKYEVGGLVGTNYNIQADAYINGNTLSNSYNEGEVISTSSSSSYTGGLIGKVSDPIKISNCYNSGDITAEYYYVGGIVGGFTYTAVEDSFIDEYYLIDECYNLGNINTTESNYVGGLVGLNSFCTISNSYNKGTISSADNSYVGGLVGYNKSATITKSYNSGEITGSNGENKYIGGIVGYSTRYTTTSGDSYITECYNTAVVTGNSYVGGIAGYNYNYSNISDSENSGDIKGYNDYVGGIAGRNAVTITGCTNSGNLSSIPDGDAEIGSSNYMGGITGQNDLTISGCTNKGEVICEQNWVGGIAGYSYEGSSITGCTNTETGKIYTGKVYAGGITGCTEESVTISGCLNQGNVVSFQYSGGIAGYLLGSTIDDYESTIDECENTGNIGATYYSGGIAGLNKLGTITNCTVSGRIYGQEYVVAVAYTSDGNVSNNDTSGATVEIISSN